MSTAGRISSIERRIAGVRTRRNPSQPQDLFPEQTAFINDSAPLRMVLCTRRAGKSYGAGLLLFKTAMEHPGSVCLYVALTRTSAKRIMWAPILKKIDSAYGFGVEWNKTELSATLPNGSVIYLIGADSDERERDKALGQGLALAIVDEAGSFRTDLFDLVFSTLKPACADQRGAIVLMGTAQPVKRGLYYDLTKEQDPTKPGRWEGQGWSGHRWGALDNPHVKENWKQEIADLKAMNPRVEETPFFRRNYLGQWAVDDELRVYGYQVGANDYAEGLPVYQYGRWSYVLGVDLGHSPDPSAFAVLAYHDHDKSARVVESHKQLAMDVTDVADKIKFYQEKYPALEKVIIDGSNKQAVAEMQNRHGLALEPADKRGKAEFIDMLNADFAKGKLFIHESCVALSQEYQDLVWDKKYLPKKREEHPGCANHIADAVLYAWRYTHSYLSSPEPKKVNPYLTHRQRTDQQELQLQQMWEREDQAVIKKEEDEARDFLEFLSQ